MLSRTLVAVAAMVAATAASPCAPRPSGAPVPLIPSTGGADLPAPNPVCSLKFIALGHGIQNYTCTNGTATAASTGALAVLYDVTSLYPGTPGTGLTPEGFNSLTTAALWTQDVPLNLANPDAAKPGIPTAPNNKLAPSAYGAADGADPFPAPKDLQIGGNIAPLPFLGHHYFDEQKAPTFDLSAKNVRFGVGLKDSVNPPAAADKGVLGTGAVKWLLLNDNGRGLSTLGTQSQVYRVVTAGGNAQACSTDGAVPKGSVPYTALYWFYG